jgi:hypothetical protein
MSCKRHATGRDRSAAGVTFVHDDEALPTDGNLWRHAFD